MSRIHHCHSAHRAMCRPRESSHRKEFTEGRQDKSCRDKSDRPGQHEAHRKGGNRAKHRHHGHHGTHRADSRKAEGGRRASAQGTSESMATAAALVLTDPQAFKAADKNRNGVLSLKELIAALKAARPQPTASPAPPPVPASEPVPSAMP